MSLKQGFINNEFVQCFIVLIGIMKRKIELIKVRFAIVELKDKYRHCSMPQDAKEKYESLILKLKEIQ